MTPGELGTELERLPGVLAATVFTGPNGEPRVYLAVHRDADPDALRDTARALLRDRGLDAGLDRIHIGTTPSAPPPPTALSGLALDALDVQRTDNRVQCTVRLRTGRRILTATATEPDTPTGRARAAARATLAATEPLDPELRLGLHGVRIHDLFGFDAVSILAEATVGRTHVQLPGTALLQRSVEHTAALATLTALRAWSP